MGLFTFLRTAWLTLTSSPSPTSPPIADQPFNFMQCVTSDDCCQGIEGICDLRLNQVLFAGAHNSYASADKGFAVPNHELETKLSLEAGFRDIGVDMCNCDGHYVLCHGWCSFGQRSPVQVFSEIVTFLNSHPTEIIVINMEINSRADQEVTLDGIYNVLTQVNGMTDMLYQHGNPAEEWPTLRTLRDAGKRIVLFHYNGANCDADDCPVGMNYYWDHAVDTKYSFRSLEEISVTSTSCVIGRGADRGSNHFFAVNSFVAVDKISTSVTINSKNFANRRIDDCSSVNENLPVTTYYVDFWSLGDVPQMVQARNAALVQRRTKDRRNQLR